jgi:hypothetical protein
MSDTIVGGAYQDAGGTGWHNAAGEPLDAAQIRAARKLAGLQDDEHAAAEHELTEQSTAPAKK